MIPLETVAMIVGHHTQGRPTATVHQIRRVHTDVRGFEDIGYHFLISPDGKVHVGRSSKVQGAHAYCEHLKVGANHCSLGIAMIGTYDEDLPTAKALRAAVELVAELRGLHGPIPLRTHKEVMAELGCPDHTDCPGRSNWVAWVNLRLPLTGTRGLL